jgi:hypothetical protein
MDDLHDPRRQGNWCGFADSFREVEREERKRAREQAREDKKRRRCPVPLIGKRPSLWRKSNRPSASAHPR